MFDSLLVCSSLCKYVFDYNVSSIADKIIEISFKNGRGTNDNLVNPSHEGKDGTVGYNSRGYLGRRQVGGQLVPRIGGRILGYDNLQNKKIIVRKG